MLHRYTLYWRSTDVTNDWMWVCTLHIKEIYTAYKDVVFKQLLVLHFSRRFGVQGNRRDVCIIDVMNRDDSFNPLRLETLRSLRRTSHVSQMFPRRNYANGMYGIWRNACFVFSWSFSQKVKQCRKGSNDIAQTYKRIDLAQIRF